MLWVVSRLSAIANPVDHDTILARAGETPGFVPAGPYMVAVGRLMPNKNFAMLLDAYARAAIPARLVILGEGYTRLQMVSIESKLARLAGDLPSVTNGV